MNCLVWEGLGNRINALASCMATGSEIELTWAVNSHCPLSYEQLFKPIERVKVQNVFARRFAYSRNRHRHCYYYLTNLTGKSNRHFSCEVRKAYRLLLRSMKPSRPVTPRSDSMAGIHYRAFMPESPNVDAFILQAQDWLKNRQAESVFVSSDSDEAQQKIVSSIDNAFTIKQTHIVSDLQRCRASVIDCARAMKVFKSCKLGVLASTYRSTVTDAARAWVKVNYAEKNSNHRNKSLERLINPDGKT